MIGEKKTETEEVFRSTAYQKNSPIYFAEDNFSIAGYKLLRDSIEISIVKNSMVSDYKLDLAGIYQVKNILTVLQAVELLKNWKITQQNIRTALLSVKQLTGLHGRWEIIKKEPNVILEVAHNNCFLCTAKIRFAELLNLYSLQQPEIYFHK